MHGFKFQLLPRSEGYKICSTAEFHLSGLIGTTSHPEAQKFRIIGFFYENSVHIYLEGYKSCSTAEFHLPGLIGTTSHPEAQKFRIIGFFYGNRVHIYLRTNNTLIHKSLYVFDHWGENLSHKKIQYNYSKQICTGRAKPLRIVGGPDNQLPD